MTASSPDVLTITGLSFGFSGSERPVLSGIALTVRESEIVSIIGGSGCGKSTLLNLIAGLLTPDVGEIEISPGGDGSESGTRSSARIGYIFQEDVLFPWRTVRSNLRLAVEIGGLQESSFQTSLNDYLSAFHLDESILAKYPSELSGGMRQRASIIQTLLFSPPLLLLDEPFSALDFYTKLSLESEFYNMVKRKKKSALFVTHDIDEAVALSDRVIIMSQEGEIEAEIEIGFDSERRDPEAVRCLPEFAEQYRRIWETFKSSSATSKGRA